MKIHDDIDYSEEGEPLTAIHADREPHYGDGPLGNVVVHPDEKVAYLDHRCGFWIIGDTTRIDQMIADLEAAKAYLMERE